MKEKDEKISLPELLYNSSQFFYETSNKTIWRDLKELAQKNRANPTEAEKLLWQRLSKQQLGFRFRRQHVISKYIVDFICIEKRLIVEVDGEIHLEQKQFDNERTQILEHLGFSLIRFDNLDVINNIEKVLSEIKSNL